MTFNEIFDKYPKHDIPNHEGLCTAVVDILRAGMELEERIPKHEVQRLDQHKQMYINDKLWAEICENSYQSKKVGSGRFIELPMLRIILEKFQILGDEKDGM